MADIGPVSLRARRAQGLPGPGAGQQAKLGRARKTSETPSAITYKA